MSLPRGVQNRDVLPEAYRDVFTAARGRLMQMRRRVPETLNHSRD